MYTWCTLDVYMCTSTYLYTIYASRRNWRGVDKHDTCPTRPSCVHHGVMLGTSSPFGPELRQAFSTLWMKVKTVCWAKKNCRSAHLGPCHVTVRNWKWRSCCVVGGWGACSWVGMFWFSLCWNHFWYWWSNYCNLLTELLPIRSCWNHSDFVGSQSVDNPMA